MNNFVKKLKKLDPEADIKTADTTPTGGISNEVVKRVSPADIAQLKKFIMKSLQDNILNMQETLDNLNNKM